MSLLGVVKDGELKEYAFDAPGLRDTVTDKVPETTKTGGPGDAAPRASTPARR